MPFTLVALERNRRFLDSLRSLGMTSCWLKVVVSHPWRVKLRQGWGTCRFVLFGSEPQVPRFRSGQLLRLRCAPLGMTSP